MNKNKLNDVLLAIPGGSMKFVISKRFGILAVHTEDVGGLTYVGRWVKTSELEDIPEGLSMADASKLAKEKANETSKDE
jgi:exopolyphosphatase/pppGpp-phosphohydrolase